MPFNVTLYYKRSLMAVMLCLPRVESRQASRADVVDLLVEHGLDRAEFTDLDQQVFVNLAAQAFPDNTPVMAADALDRIGKRDFRFSGTTGREAAALRGLNAQGYGLLARAVGASWPDIEAAVATDRRSYLRSPRS